MNSTLILNADGQPMGLLPISALTWKKAIPEMWSGNATVLHVYDHWTVHSPSISLKVPAVMAMNKFTASKRVVRFNRKNIFIRDGFTCQYCRQRFPYGDLTYDHVVPVKFGGKTTWTNIASACGPCNGRRGHNEKIKPFKIPYKPTYWEMADKCKSMPIIVPHESWTYYLDWKPELITIQEVIPNKEY